MAVGGTIGALLTGVFASSSLIEGHPAGAVLAEQGRIALVLGQLQAVLVAYGLAAGGTLLIALTLRQCGVPFRRPRRSGANGCRRQRAWRRGLCRTHRLTNPELITVVA